ncbi:MAG: histidine kinase [Ferruginibacter sp.]
MPASYYNLKTNIEKATYLKKLISDSISKSAYSIVPDWAHLAIELIGKNPKDTLLPWLYRYLGDAYESTKYDSAAHYFTKSLNSFKAITPQNNQYLHQSILYDYIALNKVDSTRKYLIALERITNALPDSDKKKRNLTNTIAQGYNSLNEYEKTVAAYRYVIHQSTLHNDSATMLNALVNMGNVYTEMDNYSMAVYYTLQALPFLKNDAYTNMVVFNNLGHYYQSLKNIDSANIFVTQAEILALKSEDPAAINSIGMTRASVMMLEKKYVEAEVIMQKNLTYFLSQPPGVDLVNCLLIFATLDTLQNKFPQAEVHLRKLLAITEDLTKAYKLETLRMLAAVNEHLGDYKDAYLFQKAFIILNDTIKSYKVTRDLAELQVEYGTYKTSEQIKSLQKEALIKDLELSNARRNKTIYGIIILGLIAAFASILYNRNLRNRTAMQKLKGELEMKALRSQMNPHFIFNSLNSIQKYIWENKQEDASEYLTKFARLIRLVLENSLHQSIKLTEELNALRLYIEMEHRRNNQKFDYSITIDKLIDGENTYIPPLLLQPYVENAIWHGLSQKDGRGKLLISIEKKDNLLLCHIEDDGIGRSRSSEIKPVSKNKTSLAMNISSQRIAWLKKDAGVAASVDITDKYSEGNSTGTAVLLTLPLTAN